MKLRAQEGDKYSNYLMGNGIPVNELSFTLKSTWAWLYWLLEVVLISAPTALASYSFGRREFNESSNDWYSQVLTQISTISVENKDELLALLKDNRLQEVSELSIAEEEVTHPMIEIYEQHSNNKKGDVLLSVKQTFRDKRENIKRNILGQWEISEQKYMSFANAVNRKLTK